MSVFDMFSLEGKTAIVTGASSGLGVTFALALAQAGADIALGARRAELLEETKGKVEALGRHCIAVPTHKDDPAEFARVLQVNLTGAYQMAQSFGRACIAAGHGGSVINISSVLGMVSTDAPQAAYSASKAGLLGITRDLAMQWTRRRGIRVNALVAGLVESDMTAAIQADEAANAAALSSIPMRRLGDPDELVGALLLLASDAGSYMTGSSLIVDGGWTAQ
jgi:NAD(P)-dependent dehydrogenase (short-subunit alcohol dehydrogenase family)